MSVLYIRDFAGKFVPIKTINGITPHIGENGNWWIGDSDTGTPARGPAGQNGTGAGTVTAVQIGDNVYSPDPSGVVLIESAEEDELPTGGSAGQVLTKKSNIDGDVEWKDIPEQKDELPSGGATGQVLAKKSNSNGDVEWVNNDHQVYDQELNTDSDVHFKSITTTNPLNATRLGGKNASDYVLKNSYEEWTFTLEDGSKVAKKVIIVD